MFDLPEVVQRLSHVGYNFLDAFSDFGRLFFFTSIRDATTYTLEKIGANPDSIGVSLILRIFDYIDGNITMFELIVITGLWLIAMFYVWKFVSTFL